MKNKKDSNHKVLSMFKQIKDSQTVNILFYIPFKSQHNISKIAG